MPTSGELPASTLYDEAYFLSEACGGFAEYAAGGISSVKARELALLDVQPGHRVLDLGCGRGEVAAELQRRGVHPIAIDYSWTAVVLTKKQVDQSALVSQADAGSLPFRSGSFDRVLLGDVIEHLPWSLAAVAVTEVERVLKPGGRALIHTSPNTWFIALIKRPLVFAMRRMRRQAVVERFAEYDRLRAAIHPNELNPVTLRRLMREAGVTAKTWVDRDVLRSGESAWTADISRSPVIRVASKVAGAWPMRLVLGNDLYALVESSGASVRSP
jgi:ubiquinone/menaquinone biosynthesis C-methylase UbiE